MPTFRRQSLVLCAVFALIVPLLYGCEAVVAPDARVPMINEVATDCSPEGDNQCSDQPDCSGIEGQQPGCGPIEIEMCVDPVTGEQYPCPPPVERIAFSSGAELESYLQPLYDASDNQLLAAEQQRGLTQSLRDYLDNGEGTPEGAQSWSFTDGPTGNEAVAFDNDGVVREDFPVSDAFLSILNAKGEFQVGDTIYKVTRDNVYAVTPNNLAFLNEMVPTLASPAPSTTDPRLTVHPVESTPTQEEEEEEEEEPAFNQMPAGGSVSSGPIVAIRQSNCSFRLGNNRRMHGVSYITSLGVYSEAGVKTEWERRKLLVFWSNTSQDGALGYDQVSSLTRGNGTPFPQSPPSDSNWGEAKIRKVLASGWFMQIRGFIETTHAVSNSSGYAVCYTRASVS